MFIIVLNTILILVTCIIVGFLCRKRNLLNEDMNKKLSNLLILVIVPCKIIVSLQQENSPDLLKSASIMFFTSFLLFFFGSLLGYILLKIVKFEESKKGILIFGLTLPNALYLGGPMVEAVLGYENVFLLYINSAAFDIILFTFGVSLMNRDKENKEKINLFEILTHNAILAIIIGIMLFLFSITLPLFISDALKGIGNMTTPLSMIILGSILAKNANISVFTDWKVYLFCLLRLIVIPVIALFSFSFMEDKVLAAVLVIVSGTPAASLTAIFAQKYDANVEFASKIVFVSTLLSMFTIPILTIAMEIYYGL